jgi:hypothetical protein
VGERAAIAASLFLGAFALLQATNNLQPDLFIYRQGAVLALRGESPYEPSRIRAAVNEQFPDPNAGPDDFQNNCGFFLPPAALLLFAPLAVVPWGIAKALWAVVCGVSAYGITRFARSSTPQRYDWLLPILLVVNYLVVAVVNVGQTTILATGCVAFGLWCFNKNRPTLGTLLWSVAFVKPHIVLPLIPLAWWLGGWKRAAGLVLAVAVENAVGATIIGGSPLFLREWLDGLASGHKTVAYNLVSRSYEITSWNRLLFVFTGIEIDQTAAVSLGGHLAWFGLILGRCALANTSPSTAWVMAAAAVGAVFVPQAMGYEVLILAMAVPWLRELIEGSWRNRALLGAVFLALQLLPFGMMEQIGFTFYRPLGVALFAALVLAGPIKPLHVPTRLQSPPADR